MNTADTVKDDEAGGDGETGEGMLPVNSVVSRHDQYHGLGRQGTKQNW